MATMDAEPLFIDTNVLVYASVAEAPLHAPSLAALDAACRAQRPLWISRQVIREFIAVRSRPQTFAKPSLPEILVERVRYLQERFMVADDTATVTEELVGLIRTFSIGGRQIHDANIVATMLAYGIPSLLTHNTKDFQRYGKLIRVEGLES